MSNLGIYLHFPFCTSKCAYCHFYSSPRFLTLMPAYISALCREIDLSPYASTKQRISSVYCGGGTPSLVDPKHLDQVFSTLARRFTLTQDAEITLEINPESVTKSRLKTYRLLGINRLSFGLQSTHDRLLRLIGRRYLAKNAFSLIETAHHLGFANLSADLIFGLPTQSLIDWQTTLTDISLLPLTHLACYSLEIHPDTAIGHWYRSGIYQPVSDPDDRCMYRLADEVLTTQGFQHYEISNWAKPGYECRHNLSFWQGRDYLGFGASAHTFKGGKYWENPADINGYLQNYVSRAPYCPLPKRINRTELIRRYLLLQSRLIGRIDLVQLNRVLGHDFTTSYRSSLLALQSEGYLSFNDTSLTLTPEGLLTGRQHS